MQPLLQPSLCIGKESLYHQKHSKDKQYNTNRPFDFIDVIRRELILQTFSNQYLNEVNSKIHQDNRPKEHRNTMRIHIQLRGKDDNHPKPKPEHSNVDKVQ